MAATDALTLTTKRRRHGYLEFCKHLVDECEASVTCNAMTNAIYERDYELLELLYKAGGKVSPSHFSVGVRWGPRAYEDNRLMIWLLDHGGRPRYIVPAKDMEVFRRVVLSGAKVPPKDSKEWDVLKRGLDDEMKESGITWNAYDRMREDAKRDVVFDSGMPFKPRHIHPYLKQFVDNPVTYAWEGVDIVRKYQDDFGAPFPNLSGMRIVTVEDPQAGRDILYGLMLDLFRQSGGPVADPVAVKILDEIMVLTKRGKYRIDDKPAQLIVRQTIHGVPFGYFWIPSVMVPATLESMRYYVKN